jgi:hypothetical protein
VESTFLNNIYSKMGNVETPPVEGDGAGSFTCQSHIPARGRKKEKEKGNVESTCIHWIRSYLYPRSN